MPYLVPGPHNNTPPKSLFFGDSISFEASTLLASYHASYKGSALDVESFPGVAPCDFLSAIRIKLQDPVPPRVLALEFYGNSKTICVGAPFNGSDGYSVLSPEFQNVYETTFDRIKAAADWVGTPVYWVTPPPHPASDPNPALNTTIAGWATARGWTLIDAGSAVADSSGLWVENLPCIAGEDTPQGCVGGMVKVRNDDLVHFQFVTPGGYSSGANRWAAAAVSGLPDYEAVSRDCVTWTCP